MAASSYFRQAKARVGLTARKWTLDSLIDVGGMAAVYAATHKNGNRVAIKVLHRAFAEEKEARQRFLREGYAANRVGHDNAVTVRDDDELEDGTPFLVMELLQGISLRERLKHKGILPVVEGLYIGDQVLDVLAAGHKRGIIHRDIKPANIFLDLDGGVKVLDYGLARVLEGDESDMTRTGTVLGTTSYMSPEQARARRDMVDHRTDIFAVGAVLFEALSGRTIHLAGSRMAQLVAAMKEPAPSFAEVVPDAQPDLVALIDRALAFQKSDRWPDARTMQQALREVFHTVESPPTPDTTPESKMGWTEEELAEQEPTEIDIIPMSVRFAQQGNRDRVLVEIAERPGHAKTLEIRPHGVRRHDALTDVNIFVLEEPDDE